MGCRIAKKKHEGCAVCTIPGGDTSVYEELRPVRKRYEEGESAIHEKCGIECIGTVRSYGSDKDDGTVQWNLWPTSVLV